MQSNDYIVDNNGNFRFTKMGLESQEPLLAKAGIEAKSIKTYTQYIKAREAASPYFLEYLREESDKHLKDKPDTLEWQALRSIICGSEDETSLLLEKMRKKKTIFSVVQPPHEP